MANQMAVQAGMGASAMPAAAKASARGGGFERILQQQGSERKEAPERKTAPAGKDSQAAENKEVNAANLADQTQETDRKETGEEAEIRAEDTKTDSKTDTQIKQTGDKAEDETAGTEDVTEPEISDEAAAQMMAQLQSFLQTIADILGINQEQLGQWMEENGVSAAELLQPEQLKMLVLQQNGLDLMSQLLTDQTAFGQLTDLLNAAGKFEEMLAANVTPEEKEVILKMLEEMPSEVLKGQEKTVLHTAEFGTEKAAEQPSDRLAQQTAGLPAEGMAGAPENQEEMQSGSQSQSKDSKEGTSGELHQQTADQILNGIAQGVGKTGTFQENLAAVRQMNHILNQVVDEIRVTVKADMSTMELQLTPEHLGRVNLSVSSKEGVMTAQFTVTNQASKEVLESQLQVLRETLESQGVRVEAIEVNVSDFGFQKGETASDGGKDSRGKNKKNLRLDEIQGNAGIAEEEEQLDEGIPMESGSQLDLTV